MTEAVLISVDKSRPVLTNSRHKNARPGRPIAGPALCHSTRQVMGTARREVARHDAGAGSRMMAKGAYNHPGRSED
jgi:hypothetical protein